MGKKQTESTSVTGPTRRSVRFNDFDGNDTAWSILCGIVFFAVFTTVGLVPYGFIVATLWAFTMYRLSSARVYQVFADKCTVVWDAGIKKNLVWKAGSRRSIHDFIYGSVIELRSEDGISQGVIPLGGKDNYGVILLGDGSDTPTKSREVQVAKFKRLAGRLRMNADVGVSEVYHSRDANPWFFGDFLATAINAYVFQPERKDELTKEQLINDPDSGQRHRNIKRILEEKQKTLPKKGREPTMAMPLSITGNRLFRGDSDEVDARALERSPLMRTASGYVADLKHYGVDNARIATAEETRAYIRSTYDATEIGYFYDDEHKKRRNPEHEARHLPSHSLAIYEDHIVVDGNFIGILYADGGAEKLTPNAYDKLFALRGDLKGRTNFLNLTIAVVGATVDATRESKLLDQLIPVRDILEKLYHGSSKHRSWSSKEGRKESVNRTSELGRAGFRQYHYNVLVAVIADNLEHLEDDLRVARKEMQSLELQPKQMTGRRFLRRGFKSLSGFNSL